MITSTFLLRTRTQFTEMCEQFFADRGGRVLLTGCKNCAERACRDSESGPLLISIPSLTTSQLITLLNIVADYPNGILCLWIPKEHINEKYINENKDRIPRLIWNHLNRIEIKCEDSMCNLLSSTKAMKKQNHIEGIDTSGTTTKEEVEQFVNEIKEIGHDGTKFFCPNHGTIEIDYDPSIPGSCPDCYLLGTATIPENETEKEYTKPDKNPTIGWNSKFIV